VVDSLQDGEMILRWRDDFEVAELFEGSVVRRLRGGYEKTRQEDEVGLGETV